MRKTDAFRRAAALMAALSITVSLAAPAFAGTYYIDYGDITITKMDDGSQKIEQNGAQVGMDAAGDETIITTRDQTPATQESDLEGLAAEDSGFGPVVEDNYQPAQPEDADQPESADRQEDADRQKDTDRQEDADQQVSADQQPQPQQAAPAPAAAPAAPTSVNGKGNGVFGNIITVINNAATALKLTLKDVKIDVSDTGKYDRWDGEKGEAALSVQGEGDVEIELDGKNELKSGWYRAGLEKTSQATGTLTLKDDNKEDDNKKAGSLTATGGFRGAGIGGGELDNGENITITGGTVTAAGGSFGAGIGGGNEGNGKNITITGGTVNAAGGSFGAGIGGGFGGSGEDITITRGTVTAAGGGYGAGIGGGAYRNGEDITINDGNRTGGERVDGEEIQAKIDDLFPGYIHHIIYDPDLKSEDNPDGIVREWWEPVRPDGESRLDLLHVETLEGDPLPFNAQQQGGTLRVTTDNLSARLHGTRQALEALREQGAEQIQFVTTLKTTTLSVEDLLAEGGSWFALEHNGLVSRQLSAAQAESLKCQMR